MPKQIFTRLLSKIKVKLNIAINQGLHNSQLNVYGHERDTTKPSNRSSI